MKPGFLELPADERRLSKEHQGPRAVLNALERVASGYAAETLRVRQDLSIAELSPKAA